MPPTISLDHMSTECLITIANAISADIDLAANECGSSLGQRDYDTVINELEHQFNVVCGIIESRGVVLSDRVVCPHNV